MRWIALFGIVMFAIAPWLVALDVTRKDGAPDQYPGWPLLFFGWLGVFGVLDGKIDAVGWLANPLFGLGTMILLFDRFDKRWFPSDRGPDGRSRAYSSGHESQYRLLAVAVSDLVQLHRCVGSTITASSSPRRGKPMSISVRRLIVTHCRMKANVQ